MSTIYVHYSTTTSFSHLQLYFHLSWEVLSIYMTYWHFRWFKMKTKADCTQWCLPKSSPMLSASAKRLLEVLTNLGWRLGDQFDQFCSSISVMGITIVSFCSAKTTGRAENDNLTLTAHREAHFEAPNLKKTCFEGPPYSYTYSCPIGPYCFLNKCQKQLKWD